MILSEQRLSSKRLHVEGGEGPALPEVPDEVCSVPVDIQTCQLVLAGLFPKPATVSNVLQCPWWGISDSWGVQGWEQMQDLRQQANPHGFPNVAFGEPQGQPHMQAHLSVLQVCLSPVPCNPALLDLKTLRVQLPNIVDLDVLVLWVETRSQHQPDAKYILVIANLKELFPGPWRPGIH